MNNSRFSVKKAGLIIAVTLCLVVGGFFLIRYLGEGKDSSGDRVVYVTEVATLIGQEISGGIVNRYGGVVESQETWSCTANSEYKIKSVLVEVGQEVSEGQALFIYDVNNLQNTLEQQKIDLERLKAELDSIVTTISALEKESKSADKTVKASYTIQIQQQQLEKKQKEFDIQAKQKEIETTEENIANQAVTSQIAGVVQSINNPETQSSDYQNGDSSFIKIIKTGELRIKGSVNEQNIGLLTEGMPVIVRSRVDSSQVWRGTITKIDRENQQTNGYASMYGSDNGSGTNYPFYVDLPTSEGLMMGQHVYLEPDLGQEDEKDEEGIWLDEWYVDESVDDAPFVWVDDGNGKLTKRDVIVGERNSDMGTVQILSGLELTDLIAFPDETCAEGVKTEKTDMPAIGADGGGFDEEESVVQFDVEEGDFEEYYGDVGSSETEAGGDLDEDFDGVTFEEGI
ncbi:MAG: efflux RND transporter periplasmic adaptor subunit [Lachnospiraceae bacterium]|nr:efflux RND transporter periplasmic adaptor subunit [Lachnospiraceae bacterium]